MRQPKGQSSHHQSGPQKRRSAGPRKLAAEELFEYAVKALGARAYSAGDLRAKLRLRAAHTPDVDTTMSRLLDVGYINDTRFAEGYAAARVANEGFGKTRVLMDLRAHRITGELAEQAVEQALDGRSEAELIQAYIERRMPSIAAPGKLDDQKKLAGAWRRLRRAGFSSGPVIAALRAMAASAELVEDFPEDDPDDPDV